MEKFIIAKDFIKKVRHFNLTGRTIEFKIKTVPVGEEPVGWIKDAIHQVIQKGTEHVESKDQVAFSFCSKDFKRGDGWVRFRPAGEVTYEDVWDVISSVYQSNSTGLNTDTFCLSITSVRMPAGKGKVTAGAFNAFQEECSKRRGIVTISNKDDLCLPRALVVAMARIDKDPLYEKVRLDRGKIQSQRALELCRNAGVEIPAEGGGINELQVFQEHLSNYKIVVYNYGDKGRNVIFKGSVEGPNLNLLYHKGHYNVITSLTATFGCSYYCMECHIPYNTKGAHRCGSTCPACQQAPSCVQNRTKIKCDDCKRWFRGQECYDNHKPAVCKKIKLCPDCLKTIQGNRVHVCDEVYCKVCQKHQHSDHMCYMQPDTGKPKTIDFLFVFYDLETRQEKTLDDGSLLHEPNLCVFKQCCDHCINTEENICAKCGLRVQIVRATDVISPFMYHLLTLRKKFKQVVVLAHNGQAFDHQFLLHYMLTNTNLKPDVIMRGSKILLMQVGNVKFLDSINYFPMALSKLPKAFGLGDSFKKGYFPHLFNTSANAEYVGPLPDIKYYSPDTMKPEDRAKFLIWYEEHKVDEFNMQRDIVEYCKSDVEILTAACLKFRQQLMETGNVCPFTEACTIASACNRIFRRNFLKPNTLGIIPRGGYRWRDNQSRIAVQWLVSEEHRRGINIQHAAKGKEAIVYGIKVDGFCSETNQILEFHGCYFHGCPSCFRFNRDDPLYDDPLETLNLRYETTVAKIERLKGLGCDVIEMWECNFKKLMKESEELRSYTERHPLVTLTPLNPRDAFYGGRTGNTSTYYKCQPGEKIKYVDVCSLYPWVCKYGKFPIGHPRVYVGRECDELNLKDTDGVIKCKILPPKDLYHPVLPMKMNDKLMFVLCRTCGQTSNQYDCIHNDEERTLTGTWVLEEVLKAIEKGYQLMEIYEVWSYDIQQFDKAKKTGGLFTDMMNKFIKIKQQASGWPKHCNTPEERNEYIGRFLDREDVKLEFAEIVENPGLRSLAKLILNSFWGKLGQRENQPKTKIIKDPSEFFGMITNPSIVVDSVLPINEEVLIVNYEHKEETYDPLTTVNVVVAAYVTTQARLKLYNYLEKLEERVLYYDTDSVIYVSRPGEFDVPTGEFLGDMTDELESYGSGSYITEFVSGGPKNYAYKVFCPDNQEENLVCKIKGISLNYATSRLINFESVRDMVLRPSEQPLYIKSKNIRRTAEHQVVTIEETKTYKPNSTKRKFFGDHTSVPFGFKKQKY